jgi:2-polyprenyl-3-methyl-5-hydroxy-6-metoxy-1,4-benzoquinol methylase
MGLLSALRELSEARLKRRTLARWLARPDVSARVERVLGLDPAALGLRAGAGDPRGLPGNPEFRASGWTDHMLLRYLLAMDRAAGKSVLDTCCGLGWGTHIVAGVAASVTAVDLDEGALAFCRDTWKDANVTFLQGSVLELPFEADRFDVVLCMEAIEHFSVADGRRYLEELRRVCRPGGVLFGSSAFPETRAAADALCAQNEHHLHIYTRGEMRALLSEVFSRPIRLTKHYFAAQKPL